MTKKHFIALADHLRSNSEGHEPFTEKQLMHIAAFCRSQNPNFKQERWLDYINGKCGPSGGKIKQ